MISQISEISFDNEAKSRKNLVRISVFLIIVSNLEIRGDSIDLLGLRFLISQASIVSFSKIVLVVALIAFAFSWAEVFPRRFSRFLQRRNAKWWKPIKQEIDETYRSMHDVQDEHQEYLDFKRDCPDWDDLLYEKKHKRDVFRMKVLGWTRPVITVTRFLAHLLWPLVLAALALCYPEFLSIFLS